MTKEQIDTINNLITHLERSQSWIAKVSADTQEGDPTGIGFRAMRQWDINHALITNAKEVLWGWRRND